MKLTAPIHVLKGNAKKLKRSQSITMAEALNQIAKAEGFNSWSLLQAKINSFVPKTKEDILNYLNPGDLLLIGGRPHTGKTTLTLQLLLQAIKDKRPCFFFSFEYTQKTLIKKLLELDETFEKTKSLMLDFSEEISSDHIINKTKDTITEGAVIAIDYLQLLDQQRNKPPLQEQIEALKKYAREKKCVVICTSQINKSFDPENHIEPGLADVRLPNPLDLKLFNKAIFVQNGQIYNLKP